MTKPVIQPTQLITPENLTVMVGMPAIQTEKGLAI